MPTPRIHVSTPGVDSAFEQGIAQIQRRHPDVHIWAGDIDEELTARGYIVPGLGDAGDLAYGSKRQS